MAWQYHVCCLWRGGYFLFASGCLDVVGTSVHSEDGGLLDVACGLQITCFQYHFHGVLTASLLQFVDIIAYFLIVSAKEFAYWHHDVNLCGTVFDGECGLGNFHLDDSLR